MSWTKAGKYLQDLLFPRICAACNRRLLHEEDEICVGCLRQLPRTNYHLTAGNPSEQAFFGLVPSLVRATSYFYYDKESAFRHIIHEMKYRGRTQTGTIFGRLTACDIGHHSAFFSDIDVIIPVPLSEERYKKRGYNQCDYIAGGVSDITGIPVCPDLLVRRVSNTTQTRKSRIERMENVEHIFEATDSERLVGKHVLLIDDVQTTGATLIACATALSVVKDIRISFLTLACAHYQ